MKAFHTSNRAPRNCWRVRLMWNNPVLRVMEYEALPRVFTMACGLLDDTPCLQPFPKPVLTYVSVCQARTVCRQIPRERARLYRGVHICWSSSPIRGATAYAPGFGVSAGTHGLTDALMCTDAARRDDACPDAAGRLSLLNKPTLVYIQSRTCVLMKKKVQFWVPTTLSSRKSAFSCRLLLI